MHHDSLNWDLEVLSRAVRFQNLSSAASNIGISQPQLSKILSKLEKQYDLLLLNRQAKRKAHWTDGALRLAEAFGRSSQSFQQDLQSLKSSQQVHHLRVGALEGMADLACNLCHKMMLAMPLWTLEIHIHDLSELEEIFLKQELDLIFSSRSPSRRKYNYEKRFGFQSIDRKCKDASHGLNYEILSSYQFGPRAGSNENSEHAQQRTVVSNSLFVRKLWLERFGGTSFTPSAIYAQPKRIENEDEALLIAQDIVPKDLWERFIATI